ncbi:hypothetical protein PRIPAC_83251 [Pristionchus pacificus]|uniref:type I protein arginine methyltransferase n=1 Tax=Pristionchus pacificus TaxID=54126 RepID=A0A2A6BGR9_PRIPA|nr:hypothetical protein PRIPAC_83251 [Pristionchus pacificus]|eukprot:PDM65082.1 hypothetical protein PRIPAC_53331 [Pristionchus pacificus]
MNLTAIFCSKGQRRQAAPNNMTSKDYYFDSYPHFGIHQEAAKASGDSKPAPNEMTSKDYYFDSYSHFGIHEEMLKDEVRTNTYRNSIYHNKHLFKDKIVMDVGFGTGIHSMFAAKSGAKRALAVILYVHSIYSRSSSPTWPFSPDKSSRINLDSIVVVIQCKIEDIKELPFGVDIIISEWMGYCLFYEPMLNTVLYARDKWLVPEGALSPDRQSFSSPPSRTDSTRRTRSTVSNLKLLLNKLIWHCNICYRWDNVRKMAITEPLVDVVDNNQVVTGNYCVKEAALTVKKGEELKGVFTCASNARNERDLDFNIKVSFHGEVCDLEEESTYTML